MGREEILKRSRAEREDEGNTFAANRGRRAGFYGFACTLLLLLIFNYYADQPSDSLLALYANYLSLESWGTYRASRQKVFLVLSILLAGAALLNLSAYARRVLG